MELHYFYKAEMPNCQDWALDVSKLNISLIWVYIQMVAETGLEPATYGL